MTGTRWVLFCHIFIQQLLNCCFEIGTIVCCNAVQSGTHLILHLTTLFEQCGNVFCCVGLCKTKYTLTIQWNIKINLYPYQIHCIYAYHCQQTQPAQLITISNCISPIASSARSVALNQSNALSLQHKTLQYGL